MNGEIGVHEINEQMEKVDALLESTGQHLTRPRTFQFELAVYGIKVISLSLIYIGQSIGRVVEEMRNHRP